MNLLRACGVLLLILLSACASQSPLKQTPAGVTTVDAPFTFNGRVAIQHEGERTATGLRWIHTATTDEILLLAPLGQVVARLFQDKNEVMLDASGKHYVASDLPSLTQQVLGWELPLSGLRYWVLAMPAQDGKAEITRNPHGQIALLRQNGWEIHFARFVNDETTSLPLRFSLRRAPLEILVVIDEWEKP